MQLKPIQPAWRDGSPRSTQRLHRPLQGLEFLMYERHLIPYEMPDSVPDGHGHLDKSYRRSTEVCNSAMKFKAAILPHRVFEKSTCGKFQKMRMKFERKRPRLTLGLQLLLGSCVLIAFYTSSQKLTFQTRTVVKGDPTSYTALCVLAKGGFQKFLRLLQETQLMACVL